MFEFIGSLFSLAFGLVKAGLSLAWGLVQGIISLLGGIFTFIISLGGLMLAGSLIALAVLRRKEYKRVRTQQQPTPQGGTYDVDKEEFTSFYDQFRTQQ